MSNLYKRLKLMHIQQETRQGCSLAACLMIFNAIKHQKITQKQFKEQLMDSNDPRELLSTWVYNCSHGGMPIVTLMRTLKALLKLDQQFQELDLKIDKVSVKSIGYNKFKEILNKVNKSVLDDYILFNYNAHYSPLGKFEDDKITILNVDKGHYVERIFPNGEGEDVLDFGEFFNRLCRQNRSIIIFSVSNLF